MTGLGVVFTAIGKRESSADAAQRTENLGPLRGIFVT